MASQLASVQVEACIETDLPCYIPVAQGHSAHMLVKICRCLHVEVRAWATNVASKTAAKAW